MRRIVTASLVVAWLFLFGALVWGQGYKTESIGALNSSDVPKALADQLEPKGTRLVTDKGAAVSEVWLLKSVALGPASAGSDAVYPSLGVGTLVGVLHFPTAGSDFRGQTIKPGYYTMRYAKIPQDGNHMGVNPYPDFILLSPVAADTQISQALKVEDLVKLSKLASGSAHPAVLGLVPVSQGATFPSAVQDDQGHWALQVKLSGGGQQLPVALILVGQVAAA